jgi:hypothetical protein
LCAASQPTCSITSADAGSPRASSSRAWASSSRSVPNCSPCSVAASDADRSASSARSSSPRCTRDDGEQRLRPHRCDGAVRLRGEAETCLGLRNGLVPRAGPVVVGGGGTVI